MNQTHILGGHGEKGREFEEERDGTHKERVARGWQRRGITARVYVCV